jgi:hypothetical protein
MSLTGRVNSEHLMVMDGYANYHMKIIRGKMKGSKINGFLSHEIMA